MLYQSAHKNITCTEKKNQVSFNMKIYYLLFINELICLTPEEKAIIQSDERILRQTMNENQIQNRLETLEENEKQLSSMFEQLTRILDTEEKVSLTMTGEQSFIDRLTRNEKFLLTNLVQNELDRNNEKMSIPMDNTKQANTTTKCLLKRIVFYTFKKIIDMIKRITTKNIKQQNSDTLIRQNVTEQFKIYDNASLDCIILKTHNIYHPILKKFQKSLPSDIQALSPLINEALRKYQIVLDTIHSLKNDTNRLPIKNITNNIIQPNAEPIKNPTNDKKSIDKSTENITKNKKSTTTPSDTTIPCFIRYVF